MFIVSGMEIHFFVEVNYILFNPDDECLWI